MKIFFISKKELILLVILIFILGVYTGKKLNKKPLIVKIRHLKYSAVKVQELMFKKGYGEKELD